MKVFQCVMICFGYTVREIPKYFDRVISLGFAAYPDVESHMFCFLVLNMNARSASPRSGHSPIGRLCNAMQMNYSMT